MSTTSEVAQIITELIAAISVIKDNIDALVRLFGTPAEETPAEEPQAKAPVEIRLEQVRAVLANKSRAGHTEAVRELLKKYGAEKLSQVEPKHYAAILKEADGWTDAP
jgi:hypothetical protein